MICQKIGRLFKGLIIKLIYLLNKRDSQMWVFGEWFGTRCGDNCTYLANYVAENIKNVKLYWIAEPNTDTKVLNSSINVITRGSKEARNILKKAGVGVSGQGLKDFDESGYNYLSGAVTLLLWHGIPWKYVGHDGSGKNGLVFKLYVFLFDKAFGSKYILSPSVPFDKIALTAFGNKEKSIIKTGYPRNSVFYDKLEVAKRRNIVIKMIGSFDNSVKIIVYMPTFRASGISYNINSLLNNDKFMSYLNSENCVVIQKAHQVDILRRNNNDSFSSDKFYNLNNIDAQSLLCAADLLITDYSGCFFDYSLLDRPIVHFLYDYEKYRDEDRGLYYPKEDVLFGTEATNEEELIMAIKENLANPSLEHERRKQMRKKYLSYESATACQEITYFLKNKKS